MHVCAFLLIVEKWGGENGRVFRKFIMKFLSCEGVENKLISGFCGVGFDREREKVFREEAGSRLCW
jgi:hypothetical protein